MKKKANVYFHMAYGCDYANSDYEEKWRPAVKSYEHEDEKCIFICNRDVIFDLPDGFDPTPKQVAALEKQKLAALAAYQQTVAEINDKLSKLQAIEFAP